MAKNFYITTPIYYPSAKPHMGHAYSSIVADFFARFKKMDGFDVYFLTGTDEHGLKIQRAAKSKGIETLKFCDQISKTFKDLSKTLNLTNTDFIRTTEPRHKKSVQHLWNELEKMGAHLAAPQRFWGSWKGNKEGEQLTVEQFSEYKRLMGTIRASDPRNPNWPKKTLIETLHDVIADIGPDGKPTLSNISNQYPAFCVANNLLS